jgi:hypothetical protein
VDVAVGRGVSVGVDVDVEVGVKVGVSVGAAPNSIMGAQAIREIVNPIRKNFLVCCLTIIANYSTVYKMECQ